MTAAPKKIKPYCNNGAINRVAHSGAFLPSRRARNRAAIISAAQSAAIEYSRASWACRSAATEIRANRAANRTGPRRRPTAGNNNSMAATLSALAAAGRTRTLKVEVSTFCVNHNAKGYSAGVEPRSLTVWNSSESGTAEISSATASSCRKENSASSWKREVAAAMSRQRTRPNQATWARRWFRNGPFQEII